MHIYSIKCYARTQRFLVLRENNYKDLIYVYKLNICIQTMYTNSISTRYVHVTYTLRHTLRLSAYKNIWKADTLHTLRLI